MSSSDLNLDGVEITILKAIGLSGGEVLGETLIERLPDFGSAELSDALQGLIAMGYVDCDRSSLHSKEELEKAHFHVNSGYSRDIKDAMDPKTDRPKSRRVRRE